MSDSFFFVNYINASDSLEDLLGAGLHHVVRSHNSSQHYTLPPSKSSEGKVNYLITLKSNLKEQNS